MNNRDGRTKRWQQITVVVLLATFAGAIAGGISAAGPWTAAAWAAAAAWATVLVAVSAAIIGYRQLVETATLRREQAQPNVVAYMERLANLDPRFIDLVIENFGQTPAHDVTIHFEPTPWRWRPNEPNDELPLPDVIPFLAPGQQWRTFWDASDERLQDGTLTERHEVTVEYRDSDGRPLHTRSVLDWAAYSVASWMVAYSVSDIGKAVRSIDQTMRRWTGAGSAGWPLVTHAKVDVNSTPEKPAP